MICHLLYAICCEGTEKDRQVAANPGPDLSPNLDPDPDPDPTPSQVAAKLQHEDKNTHKAQEINAKHALEQLGIIEGQLLTHRGAAELFESPELRSVWKDMEAVREH